MTGLSRSSHLACASSLEVQCTFSESLARDEQVTPSMRDTGPWTGRLRITELVSFGKTGPVMPSHSLCFSHRCSPSVQEQDSKITGPARPRCGGRLTLQASDSDSLAPRISGKPLLLGDPGVRVLPRDNTHHPQWASLAQRPMAEAHHRKRSSPSPQEGPSPHTPSHLSLDHLDRGRQPTLPWAREGVAEQAARTTGV